MKRPLEKRVNADLQWIMSVVEMPTNDGTSYPVFEWSFGAEDGLRGGELRAQPLQGILVFETRRGDSINGERCPWTFDSIEQVLEYVDHFGWGEPPHIDEVFQDILNAQKKFPVKGKEDTEQIFQELRRKWEDLVAV